LAPVPGNPIEGEVFISLDRVKENSISLGTTFSNELLRVIFHGVLHLCGYKDKTRVQSIAMRSAEDKYLSLYEQYIQ
jgi:rRNA maturation RNase YbeY